MRFTLNSKGRLSNKGIRRLIEHVKEQLTPANYDQNTYCGGECCLAGHMDMALFGKEKHFRSSPMQIVRRVKRALGLKKVPTLFDPTMTEFWQDAQGKTPRGKVAVAKKKLTAFMKELGV